MKMGAAGGRRIGQWAGLLATMVTVPLACASSTEGLPPGAEGEGGQAAADGSGSGTGGTNATSASATTSTSGATGGGDCPHEGPPVIDPSTLPACPSCPGAHCVPKGVVPPDQVGKLGDCDADNKCVPDEFIETGGKFIAPTCKSIVEAEGRCLSKCIPEVEAQADLLPQSSCGDGELCVPCYNPKDGMPSGACELSCDPGPVEPPKTFPKCCDGQGSCVPEPAVPADKKDNLSAEGCPEGQGLLCAPDVFVNDPNFKPAPCETSLVSSFFGEQYKPGACLPGCLKAVDNFLIQEDGCPSGFKCAPCLKPPFGEPSGACEL